MKFAILLISACLFCSVSFVIPCGQQPQTPSSRAVLDKERAIHKDSSVLSLAISPNGNILVAHFRGISKYGGRGESIYEGGNVEMWTFPDLKPLKRFGSGLEKDGVTYFSYWFFSHRLAITRDSKTLILGGGPQRSGRWGIPLVSLPDGKLITPLESKDKGRDIMLTGLTISADGKLLVAGYSNKLVELWSLAENKLVSAWKGRSGFDVVAIAPNNQILASASSSTIELWSLPDGKLLAELKGHKKFLNDLAITPDNTILASASADSTVKLWSLPDGKLLTDLQEHQKAVNALAITANGKILVTGSDDTTIKLWSLPEGRLISSLQEHRKGVNALASAPDGKTFVSGGADGSMLTWVLD
jgi:WD40 repeat protein